MILNRSGSAMQNQTIKNTEFRPLYLIIIVLLLLLLISLAATWYGDRVVFKRFCLQPQQHLSYLEQVLRHPTPAGDQSRRPYIIAAKLLFLLPRQPEETIDHYLGRVKANLQVNCQ